MSWQIPMEVGMALDEIAETEIPRDPDAVAAYMFVSVQVRRSIEGDVRRLKEILEREQPDSVDSGRRGS